MDFSIRKLEPSDYEDVLVGWWKEWGWQAPAQDFLPENGEGGLMVMVDNKPVCAGFMYITNSKVSWVDWIISDNKICLLYTSPSPRDRQKSRMPSSA